MVDKIDTRRNKRDFWKQVNRMLGRGTPEKVRTLKNENGRDLNSKEEVVLAFRGRMERTFKEENEDFDHDSGRERGRNMEKEEGALAERREREA